MAAHRADLKLPMARLGRGRAGSAPASGPDPMSAAMSRASTPRSPIGQILGECSLSNRTHRGSRQPTPHMGCFELAPPLLTLLSVSGWCDLSRRVLPCIVGGNPTFKRCGGVGQTCCALCRSARQQALVQRRRWH